MNIGGTQKIIFSTPLNFLESFMTKLILYHFIATLCYYELQAVENDMQELYIYCTTKRLG